jgi:hypothetical protein
MNTNIERKIDLNFPIEEVKQNINRVVKQGAYTILSQNEILSTYRIGKIANLEQVIMNITLKPIDTNTNIHIVVSERIRNQGHQSSVEKIIDAFLERLSKGLTGASDEELKSVSAGNKGCLVFLLPILGVGLYYLLS